MTCDSHKSSPAEVFKLYRRLLCKSFSSLKKSYGLVSEGYFGELTIQTMLNIQTAFFVYGRLKDWYRYRQLTTKIGRDTSVHGAKHFGMVHCARQFGSLSELSFGHFDTSAEVSRQFKPNKPVPQCLGSELYWV